MKISMLKSFIARCWPGFAIALVLTVSSLGCAHASSLKDSASESQSYYYFIKSHYSELNHDDKSAVQNMLLASTASGGSYYLELETAKLFSRIGDAESAAKHALKAINLDPDRGEARVFLGWLYSIEGRQEEAMDQYNEVLRLNPTDREALLRQALLYLDKNDKTKAEAAFKKLVEVYPNHLSYFSLGHFYKTESRNREAIEAFKTSTRKNPEFYQSYVALTDLYEAAGDRKSQEKIYREMLKLRPDDDIVKIRLASLLLKNGRKSEAGKLLDGNPNLSLGKLYIQQGRLKEALGELEAAFKAEPGNDEITYFLAIALMETAAQAKEEQKTPGPYKENIRVRELLEGINKSSDFYVDARLLLATTAEGETLEARLGKALPIVEAAAKERPDSPRLAVARTMLLDELGNTTQALAVAREAAKKFPTEAEVLFRLGVFEDKQGNKKASIAAMQKVIQLEPMHADALNYLAYTWADRRENLREALALAERADRLKPDSGYILDTLGWIHYHLGNTNEALALLQKAAPLSNDDPVVMDHLGDVLSALGRNKEALDAYKKALDSYKKAQEIDKEKPPVDPTFSQEAVSDKAKKIQQLLK